MAPIQNLSASKEKCWQDYFGLISWQSEGGKIPPDEEPPEPPLAPSLREHVTSKEPINPNPR
jgi:hypothetical protein